jgi:hypothetical protein
MTGNDWKWPKIARITGNDQKWLVMTGNKLIWPERTGKDLKGLDMTRNDEIWPEMTGNHWKLLEMTQERKLAARISSKISFQHIKLNQNDAWLMTKEAAFWVISSTERNACQTSPFSG